MLPNARRIHAQPMKKSPSTIWRQSAFRLCLGPVLALGLTVSVRAEDRPNFIVIFTDDQGYADLGAYGLRDDVKTPNLDRLAREGVLFTDGYITAPQCSPSRAGLLTGRYQQRFGFDSISEGPLPLEERRSPTGCVPPAMPPAWSASGISSPITSVWPGPNVRTRRWRCCARGGQIAAGVGTGLRSRSPRVPRFLLGL